jgi:hypothetical protein
MNRFIAWLGEIFGTAVAGPGATVIGDPGLVGDGSRSPSSAWRRRLAAVLLLFAVLVVASTPWPLVLPLGILLMAFLFLDRRTRRRG